MFGEETEPRKFKHTGSIGRLSATLTGQQYKGSPILDTEVKVEGDCLCWITWGDKEKFLQELNDIILKYQI